MWVKTQDSNVDQIWSPGIGAVRGNVHNQSMQGIEFVLLVGTKRATLTAPSMSHIPQLTLLIPQQSKTSSLRNDTGSCLATRRCSLWHRQIKKRVNEEVLGWMFNACYHFIFVNREQCNENTKKRRALGVCYIPVCFKAVLWKFTWDFSSEAS